MIVDKGVYTPFTVHLENTDFSLYQSVILTIKAAVGGEPIVVREYSEAGTYLEKISPEESEKFRSEAVYDFDAIDLEGERIKISKTIRVPVERGIGEVRDDSHLA